MARTVNEQGYAEKRKEILDTAQRLIMTRGYERMTIGDILAELRISSGAFYHYFPSKSAVLEALIEYMMQQAEGSLIALVHDPQLTALEKLQRYFGWIEQARVTNQSRVLNLMHTWYTDDNAIVRQKVDLATLLRRAPLLNEIVRQGIQEGTFTTAYPDQSGEIILSLAQGMGNTHARLMLSVMSGAGDADSNIKADEGFIQEAVNCIVVTHAAYMDAIEHVLGAPAESLYRTDVETAKAWVAAVQGKGHA
jgi:AcrR family transcriptional regulator